MPLEDGSGIGPVIYTSPELGYIAQSASTLILPLNWQYLQFEKATTKHLNFLTFMLEVNLRMDLSYVYYS